LEIGDTAGCPAKRDAVRLAQDAGMVPFFEPHRTDVRRHRAAEPSAAISSRRLMQMRSFAI
jgi:hypothetical protein